MRIETALDRYLVQLEADGRSEHTRAQYRRHILLLAAWARHEGLSGEIEDFGHEDLAAFLASPQARTRRGGGLKRATTVNALRSSLRTFFGYQHEAGYVAANPARLIRRARCGAPPPRALSESEQKRLLAVLAEAEQAGEGPQAVRDHALFALMLATGIRLGSALALDRDDVDLERGELVLRMAKGDRPDRLPLGRGVREHLARYMEGREPGPLFTTAPGRRMCPRHARRRFLGWLARAGIQRLASPHSLRHSFATTIYRRTGDIGLVQLALRHKSIASTLVYARADEAQLRQAIGA